jgi:hypothetical protein
VTITPTPTSTITPTPSSMPTFYILAEDDPIISTEGGDNLIIE